MWHFDMVALRDLFVRGHLDSAYVQTVKRTSNVPARRAHPVTDLPSTVGGECRERIEGKKWDKGLEWNKGEGWKEKWGCLLQEMFSKKH